MFRITDLIMPESPGTSATSWAVVVAVAIAVVVGVVAFRIAKRFLRRRMKAILIAATVSIAAGALGVSAFTFSTADAANTAKAAFETAQIQAVTGWARTTYGVDINPSEALDLVAGHPVEISVDGVTQRVSLSTDVAGTKLTVANNEIPTLG
ncbi:hypothetical protein [Leifsonia sp. Leaf264]|uniref:hypothetical protein n=1 Tax=Leifsonia sp. Leaf264 TaxID=1736314 RepID=UPI00072B79A7|nr:hypothetical protein [Leifsonia sp. Leaf264]KQO98178.1 hypothetical protein ASF30_08955 [Leifsonia sp. Leaf264]